MLGILLNHWHQSEQGAEATRNCHHYSLGCWCQRVWGNTEQLKGGGGPEDEFRKGDRGELRPGEQAEASWVTKEPEQGKQNPCMEPQCMWWDWSSGCVGMAMEMKLETQPPTPGQIEVGTRCLAKKCWLHPEDSGLFTQGDGQIRVIENSPEGKGQIRGA